MKTIVQKIVTVLAVYKFRNVARICFEVLSSNGTDRYHTCFQGDGRESCTCPSTSKKGCYHLEQLRPRAQAYFESQRARQPTEAERDEAERLSQWLQADLVLHQAEQYTKAIDRATYVQMYDPCAIA